MVFARYPGLQGPEPQKKRSIDLLDLCVCMCVRVCVRACVRVFCLCVVSVCVVCVV